MPRRPYRWRNLLLETLDYLAPMLNFNATQQALYFYFLRHTFLAGQRTVRFTARQTGRALRMHPFTVKHTIRQLERKGCLRIVRSDSAGFEVAPRTPVQTFRWMLHVGPENISYQEQFSEARKLRLRRAMLKLQEGRCFYCLRRVPPERAVLDHVVSRAARGSRGLDNLVACCGECNRAKRDFSAADFLRTLFRDGYLSSAELESRMAALSAFTKAYAALADDPETGFRKYHRSMKRPRVRIPVRWRNIDRRRPTPKRQRRRT